MQPIALMAKLIRVKWSTQASYLSWSFPKSGRDVFRAATVQGGVVWCGEVWCSAQRGHSSGASKRYERSMQSAHEK